MGFLHSFGPSLAFFQRAAVDTATLERTPMAQPNNAAQLTADVQRFERWLHSRQYPADCGSTVGAFPQQSYFWGLGLGAQMVAIKFGLLNALLQGQVYHLPTSHYTNPLSCPSRSFDCYFERTSHCTREQHKRAVDSRIYWCTDVPAARLTQLAGLSAVHPKEWYQAQLAAFLFRPNGELRAFRSRLLSTLERSDPFSNSSRTIAASYIIERKKKPKRAKGGGGGGGGGGKKGGGGGGAGGSKGPWLGRRLASSVVPRPAGVAGGGPRALNGSCVAVHIRRTDKFKTNRKEDHLQMKSFVDYAQLFKVRRAHAACCVRAHVWRPTPHRPGRGMRAPPCMALRGRACPCMPVHARACPCMPVHARA